MKKGNPSPRAMSIKTRFSILLIGAMTLVLLVNNVFLFSQTRNLLVTEVTDKQDFIAFSNEMGIRNFCSAIDQSFRYLTGDRLVGKTLSLHYEEPFETLNAWDDIVRQFSQCSVALSEINGYSCYSFLFLNNEIPLAAVFSPGLLDMETAHVSNVFSNTAVKDTGWYQKTMELNRDLNLFIDDTGNMLCLARKIQNVYYTGQNVSHGIGVMVVCINRDSMESLFQFSQITPNTQIVLLNDLGDVLYESRRDDEAPLTDLLAAGNNTAKSVSSPVSYRGKEYLLNLRKLNWGMSLGFLIPYSDLDSSLTRFQQIYIAGAAATLFIAVLAFYLAVTGITRPIVSLAEIIRNLHDTRNLDPNVLQTQSRDEIGTLYRNFQTMVHENNDLLATVTLQAERQKETELKALQAQINPHFLYNAMNAINLVALSNGQDEIADMVTCVAKIMRYAILNPDTIVTVREELNNLTDYIALQQIRCRGGISMETDLDEAYLAYPIPKLMLQPLVENSIQHGMAPDRKMLCIHISAYREGERFVLSITDNGRGCDSMRLNEYLRGADNELKVTGGFGIRNVDERLRLKFHGAGWLVYRNLPNGCLSAEIHIDYKATFPPGEPMEGKVAGPPLP